MVITFLGTGTSHGVPLIGCACRTCTSSDPHDRRLRPSIHLETEAGLSLLVDAGPDLRLQALTYGIAHVDAILFTHGHADHILGLDETRRFSQLLGRPMRCYGDAATLHDIRRMFAYVFDAATPRGGGLPKLELIEISGPFEVDGEPIVTVPIFHGARPILGFRLGRFAYLTDCSRIPETSWALLDGLEVVVLDALRARPHPTHFTIDEAVAAARRIGAGRTWFTHMTHDLVHEETNERLPKGMALAHDGLTVKL